MAVPWAEDVRIRLALALLAAPAALASAGSWRVLPPAPIVADNGLTSAWTGRQLIVFGRQITKRSEDGAVYASRNVAAAYDPAANRWRRLSPLAGPSGYVPSDPHAVWTGKELVVWGSVDQAFSPSTGRWRRLPKAPGGGRALVVWAGREVIGWGGGCCGDAFADGVAYRPAANTWRKLQRSPLAGSQHPVGAWTGKELVILVGGFNPDGKPWPARLARAAAYDPATGRWRRIARLPAQASAAQALLGNARAVWDGREVLLVGSVGRRTGGYAYNPGTNRWRRLPRADTSGRTGAAMVWTGRRLIVWGGRGPSGEIPAHGLAYDPQTNRWSPLPPAPIFGRPGPAAVWSGRELIVWGGGDAHPRFADGAAFRP
jgi:N-acetylneuraminic acid mutarotase